MNEYKDPLDIVNEDDKVVGRAERSEIHQKGWLHREIHVYFLTPDGKAVFQRRSYDKDTFPGKLDASVGGHVDSGDDYPETAIREVEEETGLNIELNDLVPLAKASHRYIDEVTGLINHSMLQQYAYLYRGQADDLRIEAGKAIGFEVMSPEEIATTPETDFIPELKNYMLDFLFPWAAKNGFLE